MKKRFIFFMFLFSFVFSLYGAEASAAPDFVIDFPLAVYEPVKLSNDELLQASPEVMKLYEECLKAEKSRKLSNLQPLLESWQNLAKITESNPFLSAANDRRQEISNAIDLLNKRSESFKKVNQIVASSVFAEEQKVEILKTHLDGFGEIFGVQEVLNMAKRGKIEENISKNESFMEKIKEIRKIRCEKKSGRDCFEFGILQENDEDKIPYFVQACDLKYQPACDEKKKTDDAIKTAELAKAEADRKKKEAELQNVKFDFLEQPLDLITPFVKPNIQSNEADPKILELVESASKLEEDPEILKTPHKVLSAWQKVAEITDKNPFLTEAKERVQKWDECISKIENEESKLANVKNIAEDTLMQDAVKINFILLFLNEFGVNFGVQSLISKIDSYENIYKDQPVQQKIEEIRKTRCDKNVGKDCYDLSKNVATPQESESYLNKSCELKYELACRELNIPMKEEGTAENSVENEGKDASKAGKSKPNTRIILATTSLVTGAVVAGLGGLSFYGMKKKEDDRKKYYGLYKETKIPNMALKYKDKAKKADEKRKLYTILGGVGVGVGAALITTGIVFYSIKFDSEKEQTSAFNLKFGANPLDGSLYLTLNW